jgi:hypothetical protein
MHLFIAFSFMNLKQSSVHINCLFPDNSLGMSDHVSWKSVTISGIRNAEAKSSH